MSSISECVVCGKATEKKCGGCDEGRYFCSKEHQKLDWNHGHKFVCSKLWEVQVDDQLGHIYITKESIGENVILLKRKPLLVFPRQIHPMDYFEMPQAKSISLKYGSQTKEHKRTCIGCCRLLVPNSTSPVVDYYRCSKCSWPLCDSQCEKKFHKDECELFSKNSVKYDEYHDWNPHHLYMTIGHLRVLLLKVLKAEKYKQFMNLEIWDKNFVLEDTKELRGIREFIFEKCKIPPISNDEFEKGAKILLSNRLPCNHRITHDTSFSFIIYEGENGGKGMVLTNSCIPNSKVFINPRTHEMTIKTLRPIPLNGMLTISFNCSWLTTKYLPALHTRQILNLTQGYRRCGCKLCDVKDDCSLFETPSVQHIKLSGVKCGKGNCQGILTIKDLIDNEWVWRCDSCDASLSMAQYDQLNFELEKIFFEVKEGDWENVAKAIEKIKEKVVETHEILHLVLFLVCRGLCKYIHQEIPIPNCHEMMKLFEEYFKFVDPLFMNHFWSAYFKIIYTVFIIRSIGNLIHEDEMTLKEANEKIGPMLSRLLRSWEIVKEDPMTTTKHGMENDFKFIEDTVTKYVKAFHEDIKEKMNKVSMQERLVDLLHINSFLILERTFAAEPTFQMQNITLD